MVDEQGLKTYRDILAKDPANFQAAVNAGNILYDGKRYDESIPYYRQAMQIKGDDVNVSTDLGTALWYSGRPDEALAQYEVSLRLAPDHAQTLFNVGIVRSDGKERVMVGAQTDGDCNGCHTRDGGGKGSAA